MTVHCDRALYIFEKSCQKQAQGGVIHDKKNLQGVKIQKLISKYQLHLGELMAPTKYSRYGTNYLEFHQQKSK